MTPRIVCAVATSATPTDRSDRPRFATILVLSLAVAAFVVLMVTASRYGYHRDELYFLEASKHLAWGYVDQPPFSVALVALARVLFGSSLVGMRLFPALAEVACVILTALLVRELGGGRMPQILAALAEAVGPLLIAGHLAGPTIYDLVAAAGISFLIIRVLRTGEPKRWLLVGLVAGVALLNKETVVFLVGALAIGLALNRQANVLRDPWLWFGVAIALAIWSPTLIWEGQHGWPTIEMWRNLQQEHAGFGAAAKYLPIQILLPGWWALPLWLGGLVALLREPRFGSFRAFAFAYLFLLMAFWLIVPDRPYYLAGLYPVLLAAGAVLAEDVVRGARRFLSERPPRRRLVWRSWGAGLTWVAATGVLFLPMALPVLPASAVATIPVLQLNDNLGEQIGWPRLVGQIAGVYRSLPLTERGTAVILTSNYGEAGAVDRFGPALGLPPAFSGHNNYWWWGPPPAPPGTTIAVGFDRTYLLGFFGDVRFATRLDNGLDVPNEEQGNPVWVCREQRAPWPALWPRLKHYG
jgi:4-amino-4-deoxy-L-arabinose transferase-like glycosyltransferase